MSANFLVKKIPWETYKTPNQDVPPMLGMSYSDFHDDAGHYGDHHLLSILEIESRENRKERQVVIQNCYGGKIITFPKRNKEAQKAFATLKGLLGESALAFSRYFLCSNDKQYVLVMEGGIAICAPTCYIGKFYISEAPKRVFAHRSF